MMRDGELLALLESEPERGMEELVEQYTGLLCAVAARRVKDREEVKDIVNETFMEFYAHRERFDPEKGSLKSYLSAICDRQAVKSYREMSRMSGNGGAEPEDGRDLIAGAELRADLAAVLEQLEPIDAQIVRQRYFGGMSFREIAAALGLPYETVKKRHQRSLKKLMKAMSLGLLLAALAALLAACAYIALRHFGIIPGYGVNTDPELAAYVLEEMVLLETEDFTFTIEDGWWNEGLLLLECSLESGTDTALQLPSGCYGISPTLEGLGESSMLSAVSEQETPERESITYCFGGEPETAGESLELSLGGIGGAVELRLRRAEELDYTDGAFALTESEGGLLAIPRRENGELIVAIYPLNEGEFAIDPGLTKAFGETAPVTVTAADGTVLSGTPLNWRPFSSERFFEWSFGPAPAGEYTLNVPYVYESLASSDTRAGVHSTAEPILFPLSLPEPEETVVQLPGGSLTLRPGALIEDYEPLPPADNPEITALREVYERFTWQSLAAEWRCGDASREIVNAGVSVNSGGSIEISVGETVLSAATQSLELLSRSVTEGGVEVSRPGDLRLGYHESVSELTGQITPGSLYYRWEHPFSISFIVE